MLTENLKDNLVVCHLGSVVFPFTISLFSVFIHISEAVVNFETLYMTTRSFALDLGKCAIYHTV